MTGFSTQKRAKDGLSSYCRKCAAASAKEWAERNPTRAWGNALWKCYRIRPEDWQLMWEVQEGACAVCSDVFPNRSAAKVDHDHR